MQNKQLPPDWGKESGIPASWSSGLVLPQNWGNGQATPAPPKNKAESPFLKSRNDLKQIAPERVEPECLPQQVKMDDAAVSMADVGGVALDTFRFSVSKPTFTASKEASREQQTEVLEDQFIDISSFSQQNIAEHVVKHASAKSKKRTILCALLVLGVALTGAIYTVYKHNSLSHKQTKGNEVPVTADQVSTSELTISNTIVEQVIPSDPTSSSAATEQVSTSESSNSPVSGQTKAAFQAYDFLGYWDIGNAQERELTVSSVDGDMIWFSLWYYRLFSIDNVSATLHENVASFSYYDYGVSISGTLTFDRSSITVSITESNHEYMPVETMVFDSRHDESWSGTGLDDSETSTEAVATHEQSTESSSADALEAYAVTLEDSVMPSLNTEYVQVHASAHSGSLVITYKFLQDPSTLGTSKERLVSQDFSASNSQLFEQMESLDIKARSIIYEWLWPGDKVFCSKEFTN